MGGHLFEDGQAARKAGNFQGCYENALAAWKLHQTSGISGLIGDCAYELGRYRESAERLSWFFERLPDKPKPGLITYMQERLARAKERVATVTVTASVTGARLAVDGRPVEEKLVFVDPGSHSFEAEAKGYHTAMRTLDLGAGVEREVALQLVAIESVPADGGGAGPGPKGGSGDDDGLSLGVPIVAAAVGVAGIIVGVAGEALRAGAKSDHEKLVAGGANTSACPSPGTSDECQAIADAVDEHDGFRAMEIAGFVVGGVGLAAAAVMLAFVGGDEPATTGLRVAPALGLDVLGVSIRGDW